MNTRAKSDAGYGIVDGVIWQQILLFFFPILLGTFFQQLYNTADAMIVGKYVGKQALAAVGGSTGNLINLIVEVTNNTETDNVSHLTDRTVLAGLPVKFVLNGLS